MRIVFLAHHGSLHTRRWVGFFAERGHEVSVVTCGGGQVARTAAYDVVDLGLPLGGKPGYALKMPAARRVVRGLAPDVVHVHWATSYGLLGLAAGVRPLVLTCHGSDVLIAPRNAVKRAVVRRVLRASSLITVPSAQMADAVHALAQPQAPVETFQYGVETERLFALADARARRGDQTTPVRLVSARPLARLYRHDVLLDGVALLRRDGGVDVVADIYGEGPEREELERRASRLGLAGSVSFHGAVAPAVVEEALATADLYASVAESDGASLALLEALALGPVPVLSDIPANRAWVDDGVNGVLTRIEPQAVAGALGRAIALDRHAVGARNRALVAARADFHENLARFEGRLEQLVGEGAARPLAGAST